MSDARKGGQRAGGACGRGHPGPNLRAALSSGTHSLSDPLIAGRAASRPQMKEKVPQWKLTLPSCPTSLPRSHFRLQTQGILGSKTKRQIYLSNFFFFHRSRSPGVCGHPGLGHFPRELTRFPFSTEDRFSNSDWPLLASSVPGLAAGQGPEVRLLVVSECLPCGLQGKAWVPSSARTSPYPPPSPNPCTHINPLQLSPPPVHLLQYIRRLKNESWGWTLSGSSSDSKGGGGVSVPTWAGVYVGCEPSGHAYTETARVYKSYIGNCPG